jgi:hypothetical protein
LNGYPRELAHLRIGRVLDAIGVPAGDRTIDTATHTCEAVAALDATESNRQVAGALEHCRQAALSDGGYLFVGRDSKITFHNRQHRRDILGTPVGTFGDGAGEIPYDPDLVGTMEDGRLWNKAAVVTADGNHEEVTDSASVTRHWESRRDDFQSLLAYPGEAAALASLFVWRYKDMRLRFPAVKVEMVDRTTQPSPGPYLNTVRLATLLAADVGTRFTAKRRPPGGGAAISQAVHVEGISEDVDAHGSYTLGLDISAAEPATSFWVLGTSTLETGASPAVVGY